MNRHNLFFKQIKKKILSTNNLIESYFNKLKLLKSSIKNGELLKNNRVFFGLSAVVILTLGYFLLPTIYNKNIIQDKIQSHIARKYNIDIKFNEKLRYGLIPKPHFISKDVSILRDKKEIGIIKNFNIFISLNNFFLVEKLEIKDLSLNETDFYITKDDLIFF